MSSLFFIFSGIINKNIMSKLILLNGFAGVGKSTIAKIYISGTYQRLLEVVTA